MATTDVRQIAHQVSSSPTQTEARVEQLKQDSEIKKALEQTAGAKEPAPLSAMLERVRTFRSLLSQTPVDQLEVREYPSVVFRVSDNTWLEAIVRYVVPPKQAGRVKTRLVRKNAGAIECCA